VKAYLDGAAPWSIYTGMVDRAFLTGGEIPLDVL
jgi:hypothetical protein